MIRKDGADTVDKPEDVGVVIEGVELLRNLQSVAFGWAMLFGLIYTLNLSYPQEVKFTFEFFQKVLLNMDGKKLSPKVQALKIKMFHWAHQYSAGQLSQFWLGVSTAPGAVSCLPDWLVVVI